MARRPTESEIRDLYRAHVDGLYDFIARRCGGDEALAEDITQETWLRAVDAWAVDGVPDRPAAWLARVATRLLSNYRRHVQVERVGDDDPDDVAGDDVIGLEKLERRSLLQRALDKLPRAQARLLEAFHFDESSVGEIAAARGLSERAVEGRLRRARVRLRQQVEREQRIEEAE
jgi:RNA polymerase sigma-70 factor (ECF subfamily)